MHSSASPRLDKPVAGIELPHFVIALRIDKDLRFTILAVIVFHRDLHGVLVNDLVNSYLRQCGKNIIGVDETDMTVAVVDFELRFKKRFELLEELRHGPMRQCSGEFRHVPSIRERVADKEIPVFLLFLPLREIAGIAYSLANFLCDLKKIRLPRAALTVGIPRIVGIAFQSAVAVPFLRVEVGEVLNVARIVVDPRQGDALHAVKLRVPRIDGR